MRRLMLFAPAILIAVGCTVTSNGVTTTPTSHSPGGSSAPTTAHHHKSVAKVGSTIVLKGETPGEKIAVKLVKVAATATADSFDAPSKGKRYFAAQFRIHDIGPKAYSDSPSNGATAIDSKGQQYQTTIVDTISVGQQFPASTKIPAGQSGLGWLVFEVSKHAKITRVQFGEDSGFGQTGQWRV